MKSYDIVENCKPFLSVWNFVVKENYRKQKIGTMMYEYFVNFARENNCDFINFIAERNNLSALSFYRKFALNEEIGFVKLINKETW